MSQQTMRALSIKQPWASLIVAGIKNIENRRWDTNYRGKLVIHAAKTGTPADMEDGRRFCKEFGVEFPAEFPVGGFIGVADFTGIVERHTWNITTDHPTFTMEQARGWTGRQPFGWILENPVAVPLYAARGKLGLFIPSYEFISLYGAQ